MNDSDLGYDLDFYDPTAILIEIEEKNVLEFDVIEEV